MSLAEITTADLIAELFRRSEVGLFAVLVGNADSAQSLPAPEDGQAPCWVAVHVRDGRRAHSRLAECVQSALPLIWNAPGAPQ